MFTLISCSTWPYIWSSVVVNTMRWWHSSQQDGPTVEACLQLDLKQMEPFLYTVSSDISVS